MKNVILAGGSGTRLWPLSRKNLAKQYIALIDDYTMLQSTALRVSRMQGKDVFVIAGGDSEGIINDQLAQVLPQFEKANIIIEPCARNTAPAIAYGCLHFEDDDVIGIFSSDHYIKEEKEFNRLLGEAEKLARQGYIVTLGIVPDSPRTGYGYIKASDRQAGAGREVERFVEKPDLERARQYLAEGNYLWNAGIFIFKNSVFLEELRNLCPGVYGPLMEIKNKLASGQKIRSGDFEKMERISIDYAVMEKSSRIVVIPSDIGWSDVGSFQSLYDLNHKDSGNNVVKLTQGTFHPLQSGKLLIYGSTRSIAAIGLENVAIIDTPDALLVSSLEKADLAGEIAKSLQEQGRAEALSGFQTLYQWGSCRVIHKDDHAQVRTIELNPAGSIVYYNDRPGTVHLTITAGTAEIEEGGNKRVLSPNSEVSIRSDVHYRITNQSRDNGLKLIEVQTGTFFTEIINQ